MSGEFLNFFLLVGHKVDFIAPCGATKFIFWPSNREKIVCNTGKTLILLVLLLNSLSSSIKFHTRKINSFFPSCTICTILRSHMLKIVYFVSSAKRRILTRERVATRSCVIRTIIFVRCIPIVSLVGVVLRAENYFPTLVS